MLEYPIVTDCDVDWLMNTGIEVQQSPFSVTRKTGIIYLTNDKVLKNPSIYHVVLKLRWHLPSNTSDGEDKGTRIERIPDITVCCSSDGNQIMNNT